MITEEKWLEWAKELQFLSQSALAYCQDIYDIERFTRIREISAEMAAALTELPIGRVRAQFINETGYQTPKLDTRAAVIRDGKVLLVQERDGRWALPGGWVDASVSVRDNALKEVLEEAGIVARAVKLVALLDHNRHHTPRSVQEITSAFVLCEYVSGAFVPNAETVDSGWFKPDELPDLALNKTTPAQIRMCFEAAADDGWQTLFD